MKKIITFGNNPLNLIVLLLIYSILEKIFQFSTIGFFVKISLICLIFLCYILHPINLSKKSLLFVTFISSIVYIYYFNNNFQNNIILNYLYIENIIFLLMLLFINNFNREDIKLFISNCLKVVMVFSSIKIIIFIAGTLNIVNLEYLYSRVGRAPIDLDYHGIILTGFNFGPEYLYIVSYLIYDRLYGSSKKYLYVIAILISMSRFYTLVIFSLIFLYGKSSMKIKTILIFIALFIYNLLSSAREIDNGDIRFIQWHNSLNIFLDNIAIGSPGLLLSLPDFSDYIGVVECETCMIFTETGFIGFLSLLVLPIMYMNSFYKNNSMKFILLCSGVIFIAGLFNPVYTTITFPLTLLLIVEASRYPYQIKN